MLIFSSDRAQCRPAPPDVTVDDTVHIYVITGRGRFDVTRLRGRDMLAHAEVTGRDEVSGVEGQFAVVESQLDRNTRHHQSGYLQQTGK